MPSTTRSFRMDSFEGYVRQVEDLLYGRQLDRTSINAALDGQPNAELRSRVSIAVRKEAGAFFTPRWLRSSLIARLPKPGPLEVARFFDPACGAGDLLLGVASRLPLAATLHDTLFMWGQCLAGLDVVPEFVRLARIRLALLASLRMGALPSTRLPLAKMLPSIRPGDGLVTTHDYEVADYVLMNPPYSLHPAPPHCTWKRGQVTAAATFVDRAISHARSGVPVLCILPDVLRSGTSYARWRAAITSVARVNDVVTHGRFSRHCDVDVFALCITKRSGLRRGTTTLEEAPGCARTTTTIGDYFEIRTGPVVAHRHPHQGPWRPYATTATATPWGHLQLRSPKRRFRGSTFLPPFVVVRRTSSPTDRHRAVATVILGREPVAVENHLLVLVPLVGKKRLCKGLVRALKNPRTTRWLNERIRCRHLTTRSLATLPFSPGSS